MVALQLALRKDPDTYYVPRGHDGGVTMRQLAGYVVDTGKYPDCYQGYADNIAQDLAGLPPTR